MTLYFISSLCCFDARSLEVGEMGEIVEIDPETEVSTETFVETAPVLTLESQDTAEGDSYSLTVNYSSIFYGPALKGGDIGYVPHPDGGSDFEKPIQMKHFLGLGMDINRDLSVAAVTYFLWQPLNQERWATYDPYLKMSHERIVQMGNFKLYADLRFHVPVSESSREAHLQGGLQSVQVATYDAPDSRWTFNLYGSARTNFFGKKGYGSDLELYLGPNVVYQLAPTVGLTLLYEMSGSHRYGDKPGILRNDGTDLEPGVTWDVTPRLNVNPYLNFYPGNRLAWDTTSVGMLLNWKLL
ncbi:MAG TPA: hypothetical protein DCS07_06850 [Bdellovibrionales bacterium]|nr:MAG: hypothetical protein A2X97_13960 [Bdellovibrionales bacterium GWA1_52_35]OFZ36962.1 MAG: hypothetical protein A2070_04585 [Bdellovibrionales bacterium GWC1_52_8]HAR42337.1 hypothetical protein [Bdellovibrionales bacterium]HCM39918.1 hypothetical protein [Bdellovibrionales bacterium]